MVLMAKAVVARAASKPDDDVVRRLVARTRAASGVPPMVEDPGTIAAVAAVLRGASSS